LLEQAGEAVNREALRERVWASDTFVDFEQGLNTEIKELRAALNDSPAKPKYIETLPKLGYRMIAPVEVELLESAVGAGAALVEAKKGARLPAKGSLLQRTRCREAVGFGCRALRQYS
jgi:DNA-binding winged helix-turn-helix (wHTH) protein